jgi:hypothetical protein
MPSTHSSLNPSAPEFKMPDSHMLSQPFIASPVHGNKPAGSKPVYFNPAGDFALTKMNSRSASSDRVINSEF